MTCKHEFTQTYCHSCETQVLEKFNIMGELSQEEWREVYEALRDCGRTAEIGMQTIERPMYHNDATEIDIEVYNGGIKGVLKELYKMGYYYPKVHLVATFSSALLDSGKPLSKYPDNFSISIFLETERK